MRVKVGEWRALSMYERYLILIAVANKGRLA